MTTGLRMAFLQSWRWIYKCTMYDQVNPPSSRFERLPSRFYARKALLNLVETITNIVYLYLTHNAKSPAAPLVGFSAALMTLSKTILYWAQEYYCGFCAIGQNSAPLLAFWGVLNG